MNLVDAVEKVSVVSLPQLPAEVRTCVVGKARDHGRQKPFWCSAQLHAAWRTGLFLAVLWISQVMLGKLLNLGFLMSLLTVCVLLSCG